MVYLHGRNIVSEEIEGVPVLTSSPQFISSNPKHKDTQSDAVNDGASFSDTMRMHPSIQAPNINSSVEFHTTPGSTQGNHTRATSSQQEQIVDSSALGLGNRLGGLPQAADALSNSFAKQHELERERIQKALGSEHPATLSSIANPASMYRDQGRFKEGEELFAQVVQTRTRVLDDRHPEMLTSSKGSFYPVQCSPVLADVALTHCALHRTS
jgi:hypothetical protein